MTDIIQNIKARLDRPLVLIGMMGAGKTQIGRALSRELGLEFADSDNEVEKAAGSSIPDIFEFYGEDAFRDVEKRVLKRLVSGGPCVIATGGGAFVNDETRSGLLNKTFVVWLDAHPDTLYSRVSGHSHRPLLQTENPKQKLVEILEDRKKYYAQAHIHVPSQDVKINETLKKLLSLLEAYLAQNKDIHQDNKTRQH